MLLNVLQCIDNPHNNESPDQTVKLPKMRFLGKVALLCDRIRARMVEPGLESK